MVLWLVLLDCTCYRTKGIKYRYGKAHTDDSYIDECPDGGTIF